MYEIVKEKSVKSERGRRIRSDTTRNREAILRAALSTLSESPRASMEDIAVVAAVNSAQPRAASSARGSCGVYVRRRRTESESS